MKSRRITRILGYIIAGVLLWVAGVAVNVISFAQHRSETPSDAGIVLGAAVTEGKPSPVYAARLDHAIDLHRRGIVRFLVLTGGIGAGDEISESKAGEAYAVARGVPSDQILTESVSHTTVQNLEEAGKLMRARNLKTSLLVSDPLHMRRACWIARDQGIETESAPTPTSRYQSLSARGSFLFRELYFYHHYLFFRQ